MLHITKEEILKACAEIERLHASNANKSSVLRDDSFWGDLYPHECDCVWEDNTARQERLAELEKWRTPPTERTIEQRLASLERVLQKST